MLLELISQLNKAASYQINMKETVAFYMLIMNSPKERRNKESYLIQNSQDKKLGIILAKKGKIFTMKVIKH